MIGLIGLVAVISVVGLNIMTRSGSATAASAPDDGSTAEAGAAGSNRTATGNHAPPRSLLLLGQSMSRLAVKQNWTALCPSMESTDRIITGTYKVDLPTGSLRQVISCFVCCGRAEHAFNDEGWA